MDGRTERYVVDEKVKAHVTVVNREFAKHLLESCEYPRQRALRSAQADHLSGEMRRGWYVEGTVLKFAVLPQGRVWLLNGQHSLNSVVETGEPMTFVFVLHRCETEAEAHHIYSVVDINKPRSWGDAFRAHGLDKELGINTVWLNTYAAAIRLLETSFRFNLRGEDYELIRSREFQLRAFRHYGKFALQFWEIMGSTDKRVKPFRRGGVMAVAMETLKHKKTDAIEFWQGAYQDDGLRQGDPRKTLRTYLLNAHGHSRDDRRLITHASALCWNEWLAGSTKMNNVYPSSAGRIIIDGTPWTKPDHDPFKALVASVAHKIEPAKYAQLETGVRYEKDGSRTPMTEFIGDWAKADAA